MKVHLSPATLIYFALSLLMCHDWTLAAILSAILIHELTHLIALWVTGGSASSVTIAPMGLSIERVGLLSHRNEIIVSLSAPVVNLILAALFASLQMAPCTYESNLGFGVINLLPIYPLDGGKALHACLNYFVKPPRAEQISVVISHIFLILFWMLGIAVALIMNGGLSMLLLSVGLFITIAPIGNSNK